MTKILKLSIYSYQRTLEKILENDLSKLTGISILYPKLDQVKFPSILGQQEECFEKIYREGKHLTRFELVLSPRIKRKNVEEKINLMKLYRLVDVEILNIRYNFSPCRQRRFFWRWLATGVPNLKHLLLHLDHEDEGHRIVSVPKGCEGLLSLPRFLVSGVSLMDIVCLLLDRPTGYCKNFQLLSKRIVNDVATDTKSLRRLENKLILYHFFRTGSGMQSHFAKLLFSTFWDIEEDDQFTIDLFQSFAVRNREE